MPAREYQKQNKRIKWAKSFSPDDHLPKRPSTTAKPRPKQLQPIKTTGHHRQQTALFSGSMAAIDRKSEIQGLENELAYSLDTLATISVMYHSILHAYNASKSQLDQTRSNNRLGEMEKELLTAYDDLVLQVAHLQRRIANVERRLGELNADSPSPSPSSSQPSLMSDCSGNESPLSVLPYNAAVPVLLWPNEMMLIECSSAAPYHCHHPHPPPHPKQQQLLKYQQQSEQTHQQGSSLLMFPWDPRCLQP